MKKIFWLLSGLVLFSLWYWWSAAVVAQPTSTAKAGNKPETARRKGDITIRNRRGSPAVYDHLKGVSRISDDVRVTQEGEDFILYADELTYNENTNQAVATKNLRVESRDSTIKGEKIFANFDTKVITIQGNVVMTSHGEKDGIKSSAPDAGKNGSIRDQLRHKPSRLTCNRIDYNYENRQATVTGNIRMTQGDSNGTCDRILYDEAQNYAQLIGNAVFRNGKGQAIKSQKIRVWIDQDKIRTDGAELTFPDKRPAGTQAAPQPKIDVPPPPEIPEDILKEFPTPVPLPTEAPVVDETGEDEKPNDK